MSPVDLAIELAAALRDTLNDTADQPDDADPEKVFLDIATKLIVRLSPIASIVPRDEIVPQEITDDFRRVEAVSRDLVRVLGIYRRSGYDAEVLEIALLNTAVRLRRACGEQASTGDVLRDIADEALKMALDEDEDDAPSGATEIN